MTYLRNCWYMAAWDDELPAKGGLVRTLLNQPVFFYRDATGLPNALFDRCPHRFAPLSKGSVEHETVVCGYHGLAFDGSGKCVRNPHGAITPALSVLAYPVVKAHRALWIWMGEPALAEPASIRDLAFLASAPDTAFNKGYIRGTGHYRLFVDNILDLSHIDFLHSDKLGGGSITRTPAQGEERVDGVIAICWTPTDKIPIPLVLDRLPPEVDRVDNWTEEAVAPTQWLRLNAAVAYDDAKFTDYNAPPLPWFTGPQDLTGARPTYAPKWSTSEGIERRHELASGYRTSLRADVTTVSRQNINAVNNYSPRTFQSGYSLLSARLSLFSPNDRQSPAAFGDNLTNKHYCVNEGYLPLGPQLGALDVKGQTEAVTCFHGNPRTVGARLGVNF